MSSQNKELDATQKTVDGIKRMNVLIDISARKLHSLQQQCSSNFQKDIFQKEILECEVSFDLLDSIAFSDFSPMWLLYKLKSSCSWVFLRQCWGCKLLTFFSYLGFQIFVYLKFVLGRVLCLSNLPIFIVEQNYSQFRETIGCKVHSPSKAENRPFERCSRYQQIPVRPSSQRQDHSGIIQCLIRAHLHNCVHA